MAENKANFALDLSNESITLWRRGLPDGWQQVGSVRLDDPDFSTKLVALRDQTQSPISPKNDRKTIVRIPRSEVLITKIHLGVFEGEAALQHAHKQIAKLTPYPLDEITFDLSQKITGNFAPVGIVARETLQEADVFARSNGFNPIYFTTLYTEKEFPREPRFYLREEKTATASLPFSRWAVAAATVLVIGLGYAGYSAVFGSDPEQPAQEVATALSEAPPAPIPEQPRNTTENPEQIPTKDQKIIAPLDSLLAPDPAPAPALVIEKPTETPTQTPPQSTVLSAPQSAPQVSASSDLIKTNDLQIQEARRDLPDVAITTEIAQLIQQQMILPSLPAQPPEDKLILAALPAADQLPSTLPALPLTPPLSDIGLPLSLQSPENRSTPPPAEIEAEPGTLVPTPEGTRGPENILIFSGAPKSPPPSRPGTVEPFSPEPDALAEFHPKLRSESEQSITSDETLPKEPISILALADPELRKFRPKYRAESVTPAQPQSISIVSQEIAQSVQEYVAETSLTANADPALRGFSPRNRPQGLQVIEQRPEIVSLLTLADPRLAGRKARARPRALRIIEQQPAKSEAIQAAVEAAVKAEIAKAATVAPPEPKKPTNTLSSATRRAVAHSPVPKKRPARLANVARRVTAAQARRTKTATTAGVSAGSGQTRTTARTPKAAVGTARPAPGPTTATVARAATEKLTFRKSRMNLVGVFGSPKKRRALLRLPSGRYVKVQQGDKVSGWKITAIGESSLRIKKGNRDQVLRIP